MKHRSDLIKRAGAAILAAVICAVSLGVTAFADSGTFRGTVTAAENGISTGGIEIEVYGSRLKYSKNGLNRYEHYYSKTVTTDSSGRFSFSKPTAKVLLHVKTDTLPGGTGISGETLLVGGNSDTLSLSKVKSISITPLNGGMGFNVTPKDASGNVIYAPVSVRESFSAPAATPAASPSTKPTANPYPSSGSRRSSPSASTRAPAASPRSPRWRSC